MLQEISSSFPAAEFELVTSTYSSSDSILEYGSGASTLFASSLGGHRYVVAVESDLDWASRVREKITELYPGSRTILWPVDIGKTGRWGRPLTDEGWQRYHLYPLSVWKQSFLVHPDVILIDGRFRAACFIASALRINRRTTILFDDYADRTNYHVVEQIARPLQIVGRMAVFEIDPIDPTPSMQDLLIEQCTRRTLASDFVDYTSIG